MVIINTMAIEVSIQAVSPEFGVHFSRTMALQAGGDGAAAAIATKTASEFSVTIPTWRLDVEREIDVLEELARIYGYNKFPNTLPAFTLVNWLPQPAANRSSGGSAMAICLLSRIGMWVSGRGVNRS